MAIVSIRTVPNTNSAGPAPMDGAVDAAGLDVASMEKSWFCLWLTPGVW